MIDHEMMATMNAVAEASDTARADAKKRGDYVAEMKARRQAKSARITQIASAGLFGGIAAVIYGTYCYSQGYFDEIPEENA